MRVLVIDDDRAFVRMLRLALTEAGHEVVGAADGAAALEIVRGWTPQVILLDVHMPGVDGRAFAHRYSRLPGQHAPIVVLSGFPETGAPIENAVTYVRKPLDLEELVGLVSRVAVSASP